MQKMDANAYNMYRSYFWDLKNLYDSLVTNDFFEQIENAFLAIKKSLDNGGKLLLFGNGGSATEAAHLEAELVCQFEKKRKAIPAIALTNSGAILTAQSNDHIFDSVFERQIEALGKEGDVAIGFTTSDVSINRDSGRSHSMNIFRGFLKARSQKMATVGLVSQKTKQILALIDHPIIIPHESTDMIQNVHLSIVHILCKKIEQNL
ncbi:MAG: SIS domain-containing protein [Patescibacteria group bacterium]